ncbi:response regulator [Cytophagaceae bacterium ABcell3]|nr:response regulator [Cytophagaceae bacterium ABcell3]
MKDFNCTLLIDDDEVCNYVSKRLLEKTIITNGIQTVSNGLEALRFIVNYDPDFNTCPELIFVDINMPVMGGIEFLDSFTRLEFLNKEKVIIVMLASVYNEEDIDHCKELGIKHFLVKPLTEEKVGQLIEEISSQ